MRPLSSSCSGPDGEPPLMYRRTIAAHAVDGRWSWHESGESLPFEHPQRYAARLKRSRLDRPLLAEYLAAMGINADDDAAYSDATFIRQRVSWNTRKQTPYQTRTASEPMPGHLAARGRSGRWLPAGGADGGIERDGLTPGVRLHPRDRRRLGAAHPGLR